MSIADDMDVGYNPFDNDYEDDGIFKLYLKDELYWTTKDLKRINVNQMTASHIEACMRIPLFHNKNNWTIVFNFELKRRIK